MTVRLQRRGVLRTPEQTAASLIKRIRSEYAEAPGLRLTLGQASRFLALDARACERAFRELENTGFLLRRADGSYQLAGSA